MLPVKKALDLAEDMKKKGLVGSIAMGKPKPKTAKKEVELGKDMMKDESDNSPEMDDTDIPDDIKPVIADIDDLVPGLGALIAELCDKWSARDKKQDEDMMDDDMESENDSY